MTKCVKMCNYTYIFLKFGYKHILYFPLLGNREKYGGEGGQRNGCGSLSDHG